MIFLRQWVNVYVNVPLLTFEDHIIQCMRCSNQSSLIQNLPFSLRKQQSMKKAYEFSKIFLIAQSLKFSSKADMKRLRIQVNSNISFSENHWCSSGLFMTRDLAKILTSGNVHCVILEVAHEYNEKSKNYCGPVSQQIS